MNWLYDTTACEDCYTAAAGLDPSPLAESEPLTVLRNGEGVALGWKFPTPEMRANPDGEDVLGFSKVPCECCESWLAGNRYAVSIWEA